MTQIKNENTHWSYNDKNVTISLLESRVIRYSLIAIVAN